MGKTAAEKAAEYDRLAPDSVQDFGQKVERIDRLDLKRRKADGGRRSRYVSVPDLPWHHKDTETA